MPLTSFSGRVATAVVAGKPERWVCCGPPQNLSGGDSSISGEVWEARVKGNPSSPHMSGYASAWGEVGGKQEAGGGWVRQQQQQSWAARRAWPSSSCLPSYLLCLSRLPPPGPTAISVVPRLPGPQSYLTQSASCSESSAAPH